MNYIQDHYYYNIYNHKNDLEQSFPNKFWVLPNSFSNPKTSCFPTSDFAHFRYLSLLFTSSVKTRLAGAESAQVPPDFEVCRSIQISPGEMMTNI